MKGLLKYLSPAALLIKSQQRSCLRMLSCWRHHRKRFSKRWLEILNHNVLISLHWILSFLKSSLHLEVIFMSVICRIVAWRRYNYLDSIGWRYINCHVTLHRKIKIYLGIIILFYRQRHFLSLSERRYEDDMCDLCSWCHWCHREVVYHRVTSSSVSLYSGVCHPVQFCFYWRQCVLMFSVQSES